ncbi:MAG: prolipoprotein diacylglyceryl transferase [Fibrobacteria bacterium]|nr:prolipoprotein diacylglyceryl transferase [Fibrobacteria bacterium]
MDSFLYWWQNLPKNLDPVIFQFGGIRLQYYGLMYILAFVSTYLLAKYRSKTEEQYWFSDNFHKDILTAAFIGVLAGGRLGYVLFYNFEYYIKNPLKIIMPFELSPFRFVGISGMSFHGGLIGVFVACAFFVWRYNRARLEKVSYWKLCDLFGPIIPLGYTFGRLGNFINGELYGRVTDSGIGMYFPSAPTVALRHPSQLYEALFEGVFCFLLLWLLRKKFNLEGIMAALYLISYGTVRFFIEYFREPDSHLGFVFLKFSMGQLLCFGMISAGILILLYLKFMRKTTVASA